MQADIRRPKERNFWALRPEGQQTNGNFALAAFFYAATQQFTPEQHAQYETIPLSAPCSAGEQTELEQDMCISAEALAVFLNLIMVSDLTVAQDRIIIHATERDAHWVAVDDQWCTMAPQIDRMERFAALKSH